VQNAITLNSGQFNLARAVGPALAGVLYARFGAGAVFLVNALSFGFAVAAMLLVQVRDARRHRNPDATVRDGFRYLRGHPALVLPPVIIAVGIMASIPLLQLIPVIATDVLGVGAQEYGLLTAMFGLGGVVGAIVIGTFSHVLRRSLQIVGALVGMAIMTLALGFAASYLAALIAVFGIGFGFLTLASGTNTALQSAVDDAYRGRVIAMYFMVVTGTVPIYALVNGWVAEQFGIRTVMVGIAIAVGGLGVGLAVRPSLRQLLDIERADR
jgi:predicted MFS family arabinose efflux permease